MGVLVLEIVVAAAVVFVVAAVAMGHGGSITHFAPDWPGRRLPEDRTLRPDDVTHLRFSIAFRGYRMSEVDEALDRLSNEIAQRDARIEQLTGRPYEALPDEALPDEALAGGGGRDGGGRDSGGGARDRAVRTGALAVARPRRSQRRAVTGVRKWLKSSLGLTSRRRRRRSGRS